jgi:Cu(I)/Ag(I) efflux system membrane fusion protein
MNALKDAARSWPVLLAVAVVATALSVAGSYWFLLPRMARVASPAPEVSNAATTDGTSACATPLYWFDPMDPQQHFDRPGKSPLMDMPLVAKCAEPASGTAGARGGTVTIAPAITQNLGLRLATVTRAPLSATIDATGVLRLNEREVAIVQSRTAGFVERVYALAPGDVIAAKAPLVDLLVPEWAGAQEEFLALLGAGEPTLIAAARRRLQLLGMPDALVAQVENTRQTHPILTIAAPFGGVIQELDVRAGMTVAAGQTLARLNGLATVWLDIAVPEALLPNLQVGQAAQATLPALPGKTLTGRVSVVLPEANPDSRTLTVRIEFANGAGALHPGLSARVRLQSRGEQSALSVPTEAVIRTGKRALVLVAEQAGRFRPVEVSLGGESGERTEILSGLSEGQQVVASGQFLIDSEASLMGITAQAVPDPGPASAPAGTEADARGGASK